MLLETLSGHWASCFPIWTPKPSNCLHSLRSSLFLAYRKCARNRTPYAVLRWNSSYDALRWCSSPTMHRRPVEWPMVKSTYNRISNAIIVEIPLSGFCHFLAKVARVSPKTIYNEYFSKRSRYFQPLFCSCRAVYLIHRKKLRYPTEKLSIVANRASYSNF